MPEQPNVLIFMVDQQRTDACGCYGSAVCRTPYLDRLASEGVRFTNAYTNCPLCSPARASLLTGLWPNHHGILSNTHWPEPIHYEKLDPGIPTLGTIFRDAGYRTSLFGKWHVGPITETSRCGFDHVVSRDEFLSHIADCDIEVQREIVRDYIFQDSTFSGITSAEGDEILETYLAVRAEEWLEEWARDRSQPFLLFYSAPGPHPGYVVPEPFARLYDPNEMELWPNVHDSLDDKPYPHRHYATEVTNSATLSDQEWRLCIARYYAFVTLIDAELGRLLGVLQRLGIEEDTIVVFCTDHGDLIGAHSLWDKGPMMYEEQLHVPLVVRWPGVYTAGRTSEALVSFMDLMPTLVEAAGLSLPQPVDARSLVPLLRGDDVPDWPDDVYIQYYGNGYALCSIRTVRSAKYKYTYYPNGMDELYDEETDPWELRNLAELDEAAPALQEMKERMIAWMERSGDVMFVWNGIRPPLPRPRRTGSAGWRPSPKEQ